MDGEFVTKACQALFFFLGKRRRICCRAPGARPGVPGVNRSGGPMTFDDFRQLDELGGTRPFRPALADVCVGAAESDLR